MLHRESAFVEQPVDPIGVQKQLAVDFVSTSPHVSIANKDSDPAFQKVLASIDDHNAINKDAMDRIVALVKSLRSFARVDDVEHEVFACFERRYAVNLGRSATDRPGEWGQIEGPS